MIQINFDTNLIFAVVELYSIGKRFSTHFPLASLKQNIKNYHSYKKIVLKWFNEYYNIKINKS